MKTKILKQYPIPEVGTNVIVAAISGDRFSVILKDVDSGQVIGGQIFPTQGAAATYATTLVRDTKRHL